MGGICACVRVCGERGVYVCSTCVTKALNMCVAFSHVRCGFLSVRVHDCVGVISRTCV